MTDLTAIVHDLHARYRVPGAGVGVVRDGRSETAFVGVTSVDNPLDTDARTWFQIGSISKTYAVSAVLRLVSDGRVGLDDLVRAHVPELRLVDESVAEAVTVRHLLNHTSGWDGTMTSGDTDPEAPLERFVATTLPTLEQVGPLGGRPEYNNAGVALAGRLVEKITGQSYEDAVRTLLLEPLELSHTAYSTDDLMTERVAVGHLADEGGTHRVARPWRWPRAGNPEGGLVSTIADQLAWAGFHLASGRAPDGTTLIRAGEIEAMRTPTARLVGNAMGEAIGLGWFLRDVGGRTTLGHAGTTNGQFAELRLVPDDAFGLMVCANGGPEGDGFVTAAVETVLDEYLGLRNPPRRTRPYEPARDGDVRGTFENNLSVLEVSADGGAVSVAFSVQPDAAARMGEAPPTFPPSEVGFLPGDDGEYVVVRGAFDGSIGAFARTPSGAVDEVAFGGRWHRRTRSADGPTS